MLYIGQGKKEGSVTTCRDAVITTKTLDKQCLAEKNLNILQ